MALFDSATPEEIQNYVFMERNLYKTLSDTLATSLDISIKRIDDLERQLAESHAVNTSYKDGQNIMYRRIKELEDDKTNSNHDIFVMEDDLKQATNTIADLEVELQAAQETVRNLETVVETCQVSYQNLNTKYTASVHSNNKFIEQNKYLNEENQVLADKVVHLENKLEEFTPTRWRALPDVVKEISNDTSPVNYLETLERPVYSPEDNCFTVQGVVTYKIGFMSLDF